MSFFRRFPANLIFLVDRVYFIPRAPQFVELKKPKQNRVKSRKNKFVETFVQSPKPFGFNTTVLEDFYFSFMFPLYTYHLVTNRNTGSTDNSQARGFRDIFKKDVAAIMVMILWPGNKASENIVIYFRSFKS